MKKVLIIGPGKQGKKYIQYFSKLGYITDAVSRTGKHKELSIRNDILYQDFLSCDQKKLQEYEYIIVSVAPLSEQERVILHLLELNITITTIIEKPIAVKKSVIEQVCNNDYMHLFIDEIVLESIHNFSEYKKIHIFANNYDIFDHAVGVFLNNRDLSLLDFKISESLKYGHDLNYKIYMDQDILECRKGLYYLNGVYLYRINFEESLNYILTLHSDNLKAIKYNFLLYFKKFF